MIFTAHAEIIYFLLGLATIFLISDIYIFYLLSTGNA